MLNSILRFEFMIGLVILRIIHNLKGTLSDSRGSSTGEKFSTMFQEAEKCRESQRSGDPAPHS
jgi:hypothetical protein